MSPHYLTSMPTYVFSTTSNDVMCPHIIGGYKLNYTTLLIIKYVW